MGMSIEFLHGPVLVVAAHPDDEVLGCGGLIAKLTTAGIDVVIKFMSDGESSRANLSSEEVSRLIKKRNEAALRSSEILGVRDVHFGKFADNQMDSEPILSIARELETLMAELKPLTVLTHSNSDLNVDHRRTTEAVLIATRPIPGQSVRSVLMYETLSSTEWNYSAVPQFRPNIFVDISAHADKKLSALNEYVSEIREWPHPRSMDGLKIAMQHRGSSVGRELVEAFELIRHVII
jgi:LmbE family N-acetylglucosaminyl deacetylase